MKSIPVLLGVDPLKCRTKFEICFSRDLLNAIVWPSRTNSSIQVRVHQRFLAPLAASWWSIEQSKYTKWSLSSKISLFQRGTLYRKAATWTASMAEFMGPIFSISNLGLALVSLVHWSREQKTNCRQEPFQIHMDTTLLVSIAAVSGTKKVYETDGK